MEKKDRMTDQRGAQQVSNNPPNATANPQSAPHPHPTLTEPFPARGTTPRTDAFMKDAEKDAYPPHPYPIADFARQIERELSERIFDHEADKRSLNWCGEQLAACAEYLREGETVVECIARNRRDADTVLGMLAKERLLVEGRDAQIAALLEAMEESDTYADDTNTVSRIRKLAEEILRRKG